MFTDLFNIVLFLIITAITIIAFYLFNKWLLKKDGVLKILHLFLNETQSEYELLPDNDNTVIDEQEKLFRNTFNKAIELASDGDYVQSVETFEKALTLKPGTIQIYINLALIYKKIKHPEKSVEMYEKAFTCGDAPAYIYNEAGKIYFDSGNYSRASSCFEKAIKIDPELTEAKENLEKIDLMIKNSLYKQS